MFNHILTKAMRANLLSQSLKAPFTHLTKLQLFDFLQMLFILGQQSKYILLLLLDSPLRMQFNNPQHLLLHIRELKRQITLPRQHPQNLTKTLCHSQEKVQAAHVSPHPCEIADIAVAISLVDSLHLRQNRLQMDRQNLDNSTVDR